MTDVELSGLEVKPYIHSQKNCRPSASGYIMEAIDSTLIIDLSHFDQKSKITIITKRISGNGKVKINELYYEVLSKESNRLEIQLSDHQLKFSRDNSCIGKIIIVSIIVSQNDVQVNINPSLLEPKKIPQNPANWKNILIKCGEVRGIKLLNDKIYASEGAFIQKGDLIESLSTQPPNCFVKTDTIKFVYPCEIMAVSFNEGFDLPSNKNKFKHFTDPPVLSTTIMIDQNINNTLAQDNIQPNKSSNVLYDSFETGLNPNTLSNVSEVIANQGRNNKGIILKRAGTFSIPLSILKPSMMYIVVVNIKKISGNGKIGVEITTTDNVSKSSTVVLASERETELHLKLNTEAPPTPGNTYVLKIYRPSETTVGDILLNKVMVINGITLANYHIPKADLKANINNPNHLLDKNEQDPIRALAKKYSRSISHNKTVPQFNFTGEVAISSRSGMSWFNKITPLCNRIKLTKDAKVLFGELGSLIKADKIFLNAFNDKEIAEKDDEILKNAKMILSPSLQNTELLNKLYPSIQVKLIEKTWPIIEATPMKYLPEKYMVMFHRNNILTKRIVESYSNDYPPLIIVGATDTYTGNLIQINEYITYDKILWLLLNSVGLIDIPEVSDYQSGILSLAIDSGIPTVTSNWFGLGKNNCKFLVAKDKVAELNIPNVNDIKNGIDDVAKLNKINTDVDHNEKLNSILRILCEG